MFEVIVRFKDLQDNNHLYLPGDIYPREGLEVSEARIKELTGTNNRRGVAAIKEVAPKKPVVEPKEPIIEKPAIEAPKEPQEHKRRGRRKRVN